MGAIADTDEETEFPEEVRQKNTNTHAVTAAKQRPGKQRGRGGSFSILFFLFRVFREFRG